MTTKTIKVITCDVCNRELSKVDRYENSGRGSLSLLSNCGGCGGGASYDIIYEDVCVECIQKLIRAVQEVEKSIYEEYK